MKRLIPLILTLLLLCGCAAAPAETTPTETISQEEPTSPVEPTGFYAPGSELETDTLGALKIYPLNRDDCYGLVPMDDGFLLFSGDNHTTLTRVSGDNLYITATAQLSCTIHPEDAAVQVSEKGITYYDDSSKTLVFLDANLKEVNRIGLPEDISGEPAMSADRKTLYYCTADALRVLDLETGLHKLLKEMSLEDQTLGRIHRSGTVLECSGADETATRQTLYISTETGETLYQTPDGITLDTLGERYFATRMDGAYPQMLTGTADSEPAALRCDDLNASAAPVLEIGGAVLSLSDDSSGTLTMNYYDLESGKRTSSVQLRGDDIPWNFHAEENLVWFLRYDEQYQCVSIYCWDLTGTPAADETVYTAAPYTRDNPDTEGLAACEALAQQIAQKYDVEILTWTKATDYQPFGYSLEPEFQVPLIRSCLEALDTALSRYPAGFLKETASGTDSGKLRICLLRSVTRQTDNTALPGLQFWDKDGNACLVIAAGSDLEQNLHHLLFHVIESRVMSTCSAYDSWDDLNPAGFEYDYDYTANLLRTDTRYLSGDAQAFIDRYSMSYPKEDRARIMEYAMMAGNDDLFTAPGLQQKLRQLCLGIREAYDLEKSGEAFPWELYLSESFVSHG